MKITYHINTAVTSNTGKPSISFKCEHCSSSPDLTAYIYREISDTRVNLKEQLKQTAEEFVCRLNNGNIPESAHKFLCCCDENPSGLVGDWFKTNSRIIGEWELQSACEQIKLYAIKEDIDSQDGYIKKVIKELEDAVKEHNRRLRE